MIVLNAAQIAQKTERIAFEIIENTFEQPKIFLAGIEGNGFLFAERILLQLKAHTDQEIALFKITIDKESPWSNEVQFSIDANILKDATVICIDDVINSGKTMIYAVKALLDQNLKLLKIATLVNRTHRRFPVQADFVGVNISTTLQDNILVDFSEADVAYLE